MLGVLEARNRVPKLSGTYRVTLSSMNRTSTTPAVKLSGRLLAKTACTATPLEPPATL